MLSHKASGSLNLEGCIFVSPVGISTGSWGRGTETFARTSPNEDGIFSLKDSRKILR